MKTLRVAMLGVAHVHVPDQLAVLEADPAALVAFLSDLRGESRWKTPTTSPAKATAGLLEAITSAAVPRTVRPEPHAKVRARVPRARVPPRREAAEQCRVDERQQQLGPGS